MTRFGGGEGWGLYGLDCWLGTELKVYGKDGNRCDPEIDEGQLDHSKTKGEKGNVRSTTSKVPCPLSQAGLNDSKPA